LDVLLINSPLFREKIENYDNDALPPLGLGYIATNLRSHGFDVELLDSVTENLTPLEILQIVHKSKPRFLGLNIFTTNLSLVREIVELCAIDTTIIIGGPASRHVYREVLCWQTSNPVNVVLGEGDYIVSDILLKATREPPIYSSPNRQVYMVNKDSYYFPHDISNIPLDRSFFKKQPIKHKLGFTESHIITSRGCIYDCAYCGSARSLNRDLLVRERSAESVFSELKHLNDIYLGLQSVRVLDDLFLKNLPSIEAAIGIFRESIWSGEVWLISSRLKTHQMIR